MFGMSGTNLMVRQTNDCPLNVHNAMMIVNVIIVIGTDGTNTWTLEANS